MFQFKNHKNLRNLKVQSILTETTAAAAATAEPTTEATAPVFQFMWTPEGSPYSHPAEVVTQATSGLTVNFDVTHERQLNPIFPGSNFLFNNDSLSETANANVQTAVPKATTEIIESTDTSSNLTETAADGRNSVNDWDSSSTESMIRNIRESLNNNSNHFQIVPLDISQAFLTYRPAMNRVNNSRIVQNRNDSWHRADHLNIDIRSRIELKQIFWYENPMRERHIREISPTDTCTCQWQDTK